MKNKKTYCISIDADIHQMASQIAKGKRKTFSAYLETLLKNEIERVIREGRLAYNEIERLAREQEKAVYKDYKDDINEITNICKEIFHVTK